MSHTDNPVLTFLAWWKRGLLSPLPKVEAIRVAVTLIDDVVCGATGQALSQSDIEQRVKDADVYLLLSPESVMSRGISDEQKGLPLSDIAEEVLPFDASELIITSALAQADKQEQLHCVLRSELFDPLSVCKAGGIICCGVAFDLPEQRLFARLDDQPLAHAPRVSKHWGLAIVLLVLGLLVSSAYVSHSASQQNQALSMQLSQLKQRLEGGQNTGAQVSSAQFKQAAINSIKQNIGTRDAEQIMAALRSIAESLPEDVVVDQLILSGNELVIDASALSATQVQANLDASGAFEASEFISSISRSASNERERFRLKASISEAP